MRAPSPDVCQHIALARGDNGHVAICPECNVIQVVLSHLSVRFSPEAFRDLAQMVGTAQARLDHVQQASAAAAALVEGADALSPSLH